jgi:hypothetical protein
MARLPLRAGPVAASGARLAAAAATALATGLVTVLLASCGGDGPEPGEFPELTDPRIPPEVHRVEGPVYPVTGSAQEAAELASLSLEELIQAQDRVLESLEATMRDNGARESTIRSVVASLRGEGIRDPIVASKSEELARLIGRAYVILALIEEREDPAAGS